MQRLTAGTEGKPLASNACIQLVVKADERMELNVTNPCLEGVLGRFMTFLSSRR